MSDKKLKELFDEQNKRILNNKLILDIDNNTDSLKLTISNVIVLEMNNLKRAIVKFCDEHGISYDLEKVEEVFISEKEMLRELAYKELEVRRADFIDSVTDSDKNTMEQEEINKKSIDSICKGVSKEMAIGFLPRAIRSIKIENEDDLIRINSLVRSESDKIQSRIDANTKTRFINLINMINESKNTSLEMIEKTEAAIEKIERKKTKNKIKKSNRKSSN